MVCRYILFLLIISAMSVQAQVSHKDSSNRDTSLFLEDTTVIGDVDLQSMMKMYDMIIVGAINKKLDYYESSDVIERISKLTKRYYDSLLEAGFTEEEALKIITENPLGINTESEHE